VEVILLEYYAYLVLWSGRRVLGPASQDNLTNIFETESLYTMAY